MIEQTVDFLSLLFGEETLILPSRFVFHPFDWSAIAALSGFLALIVNVSLIFTVIFGFKTVRAGQISQNTHVLIWAAKQMDDIKDHIHTIRTSKPNQKNGDKYELAAIKASAVLQRLAYMALNGLIDKVHFKNMWGLTFVRLWQELEPWVKEKREQNGEPREMEDGAFSRIDFERLALEFQPLYASFEERNRSARNIATT